MHKYGIGSGVHLVCKSSDKYIVHPDLLEVVRLSVDECGNHYSLVTPEGDAIDWCREEYIFSSRADAKRACEELNTPLYSV